MTATPPPGQPAIPGFDRSDIAYAVVHLTNAGHPGLAAEVTKLLVAYTQLAAARATDPGPAVPTYALVADDGRCGCCAGTGEHPCGHECDSCDGAGRHPDSPVCTLPHGADCRCPDPGPAAPTTYALPADPARPDGLHRKYRVARADGRDKPGGDKAGAAYFVLDYVHDPYARIALAAYAEACAEGYPALAADLRARVPSTVAADLVQPRNPKPASDGDPRVEIAANAIGWELHRDGRPVTDLGDGNESIAVTATETDLARRAARRVVAHLDGYAGRTTADLAEPTPPSTGTTLTVPDSPKMLRETLCAAQVALGEQQLGDRRREHIARLGRLIAECGPLSTGPPAGTGTAQ